MNLYNLKNPFISRIKNRTLLSKEGSTNKTYHIVLDIKNSKMTYKPGDSAAIIPENDLRIVDLTIKYMKADPNIEIIDPKSKEKMKLVDFLQKKANIKKAKPGFVKLFEKLEIEDQKNIIMNHHIWDILKLYPKHKVDPQIICDNLMPIIPRLYSIASSINAHLNEVHLLVKHLEYDLSGIKRNGVATEYLCHITSVLKSPIKMYLEPSHGFNLIEDDNKPILMIATGSGLAPFKAFLEERLINRAKGKNWLFFGERNIKKDFYFENFLKDLVEKDFLRLDTAFSRDQEKKIYVQDKILENSSLVSKFIEDGAIIYLCGDPKMAKDVDKNLKQMFMDEMKMTLEESGVYLKSLIKSKRYLKDVY